MNLQKWRVLECYVKITSIVYLQQNYVPQNDLLIQLCIFDSSYIVINLLKDLKLNRLIADGRQLNNFITI